MDKFSYVLIYDSECLLCSSFVRWLDKFAKNKLEQLVVIPPSKIYEINIISSIKLSKEIEQLINEKSRDSIIFLSNKGYSLRVRALLKLLILVDPKNKVLNLFAILLKGPFMGAANICYKLIANNRLWISNLLKKLGIISPFLFKRSCIMNIQNFKIF